MAKTKRQPFTPRGPFVVARPFRWEGRDYKPGEDFEARRMAVNQRRLQLLYDAKSIDVKGDYLPTGDADAETDLKKLKKDELLALAKDRGVTVDDKATRAEILEALEKKVDAPPPNEDLVAGEGEFLFDTAIHAVEKYENDDWVADEEKFLVQISPKAAERLAELKEGKSIITALEIVEWPEPADDDTAGGDA
jgi:hypothetical protein